MQSDRYPYSPIIDRPPLSWPNGARLAVCVIPNIECFHIDKPLNRENAHLPDVQNYSMRDYGARVGVFRMMDVLDKYGIRASAVLNADVCEAYAAIIEQGKKRAWEWLGHGVTNHLRLHDYPQEQEREIIREVKQAIAAAVGKPPRGWLSPGLAETVSTLDHLAAEGFEYVCDWASDDQPIPMRVRRGRMLALPVHSTISDIVIFLRANRMPEDYFVILREQFDTLYREGAKSGRVMALPLHPFIIGLPFRIKSLDKTLEYICSHDQVWLATGGEIVDWYNEHHSARSS
ncbi:MAG TPA: polysaccharide deacetylase family protein [Candidatus Binatia bacterium]|jgi:peptidoglycan/xylan/chitin deacetylase (PgdA/CDA1 family)